MTSTFIIAEAGANHNRNFNQALSLIDVAADAGADACKFQTFKADKLFSTKSKKVNGYEVLDMFKQLELPREWQKDLKQYCEEKNIEFMSTPFDESAVNELYNLGVKRFKIAGFESTDLRFIKYVASTKLPIIISAGIGCDIYFVEKIIETCHSVGCYDITILHCNNGYPTPIEDTNLLTIPKLIKMYNNNIKVGFSDHTLDTITPSLAVALGATTIEKHYTLSKHLPGPDHGFALEPNELKEMVSNIRHTEKTLDVKQNMTESELISKQGQRSVIAKTFIKSGEPLTSENTTTKRPYYENSIHARSYFDIVNKNITLNQDLNPDDFILWNQINK